MNDYEAELFEKLEAVADAARAVCDRPGPFNPGWDALADALDALDEKLAEGK